MVAQLFVAGQPTGAPVAGDPARLGPFDPRTRCLGFSAGALAQSLGLVAGPETTRADPVALAQVAARRLDRPAPPAPLYLRPADALPPSEAPPLILDDA